MPRPQDSDFEFALADAISARRLWLAMSQGDLADCLEVSPSQISKYETGADRISAIVLARIATALGTTPNDLLGIHAAPADATAHFRELSGILADPQIMDVVRLMQKMNGPRRWAIAAWVKSITERLPA